MRRPIAFRPTCSLVFSVPVCSNVCTSLPPGCAWLLRPCPLVCHAVLKGDRALPSGVGPADSLGAYGGLLGPMGSYGDLWGLLEAYGGLWGPMGTYGHLWGPMGTYGG